MRTYLKSAFPRLAGDNILLIVLDDEVAAAYLGREEHKKELEEVIAERIESQVEVRIQLNETNRPAGEVYPDLRSVINMEVVIEDDE